MKTVFPDVDLNDTEMCAGREDNERVDDGGAPLVCQGETGQWYLAGLTSWQVQEEEGAPAVFTRADSFIEWINEE